MIFKKFGQNQITLLIDVICKPKQNEAKLNYSKRKTFKVLLLNKETDTDETLFTYIAHILASIF